MTERSEIWVVDRVERDLVVLVRDSQAQIVDVDRGLLPVAVSEGDVLRVPVSSAGPAWAGAVKDEELRRSRTESAREALEELRKRDPGGDIVL